MQKQTKPQIGTVEEGRGGLAEGRLGSHPHGPKGALRQGLTGALGNSAGVRALEFWFLCACLGLGAWDRAPNFTLGSPRPLGLARQWGPPGKSLSKPLFPFPAPPPPQPLFPAEGLQAGMGASGLTRSPSGLGIGPSPLPLLRIWAFLVNLSFWNTPGGGPGKLGCCTHLPLCSPKHTHTGRPAEPRYPALALESLLVCRTQCVHRSRWLMTPLTCWTPPSWDGSDPQAEGPTAPAYGEELALPH